MILIALKKGIAATMTDRFKALFLFSGIFCLSLGAQQIDENKVLKVKAAYVYNFIKFARWPAASFATENDPLVVAVLAKDAFAEQLNKLVTGKKIRKRGLTVKSLQVPAVASTGDAEQRRAFWRRKLAGCHLLYIGDSHAQWIPQISALKLKGLLTVSDMPGFARQHGVIELYLQKTKIIFAVNLAHMKSVDVKLSSKLLKLAKIVEDK